MHTCVYVFVWIYTHAMFTHVRPIVNKLNTISDMCCIV